jgi:hypothetical protein
MKIHEIGWFGWNEIQKNYQRNSMYLCLVPHTLSPSRRLNSESQTHWFSGLTLSLKKKSESKPALFVFIKNPQHVCLVFYTLFCALRVSDYKGIINMSFKHVVQNWWFSFKRILFCIQVSHYENTTARFCIGFEPFVPDVQLQISNLSISERNRWKY